MPLQMRVRQIAAVTAALAMVLQPSIPVHAAARDGQTPSTAAPPRNQAQGTQPPAGPKPAAAPEGPVDGGWPRSYDLAKGGRIVVYEPQISSWSGERHLVAYAAVSHEAGTDKPALGTIRLEADTEVSVTERLVSFQRMKITEASFQTLDKDRVREITALVEQVIPDDDRVIALDRVLASVDKSTIVPRNIEGLKADPPKVFFSQTPAVIVNLDGEPIWSPIMGNDLKYAVNTNWDLFQHEPTSTLFLRNEDTWLKAAALGGPWSPAGKLPESFAKLPADENWKEVKASLPGKSIKASAVPRVFVSQEPAELILLDGAPKYQAVASTQLLWVSNTESDLFRMGKTGLVYYLVAGRWFSAPDFGGPWTFATTSLPDAFAKIPLEHERSRVLASVPGTPQAAEAVLLAQIPQVARVNRKEVKAPEVAFQGEPQFQTVETTSVQRAVNTDKDVFKVGEQYYMCYQGVWFVGKTSTGPWEVAETIPQEIYRIPPSSPSHHVTYVTVEEDDDDDDWVVFAAAAGYTGMMIAWGCAVWGTGWYYPPYWGFGGGYPYYYGHFPTYGYSAWYNPWTGGYGRSAAVYGPYGGAGVGARYNPRTGTYARGAAAYGPYGARGVAHAYNPRTGAYGATRQGSNVYGSWGSTGVRRGDDWAVTNRYTNRQTGTTTRTVRTDEGSAVSRRGAGGGTVAAGSGGDIYAGRDGNVYRREDGTWQRYDDGNWSNTDRQPDAANRPAATPRAQGTTGDRAATTGTAGDRAAAGTTGDRATGAASGGTAARTTDRSTVDQLDRDSAARREGSQRTSDYGGYRSGSSTRSTGSYRGGGGARTGGGRRR